jgi:hypothetical protein
VRLMRRETRMRTTRWTAGQLRSEIQVAGRPDSSAFSVLGSSEHSGGASYLHHFAFVIIPSPLVFTSCQWTFEFYLQRNLSFIRICCVSIRAGSSTFVSSCLAIIITLRRRKDSIQARRAVALTWLAPSSFVSLGHRKP